MAAVLSGPSLDSTPHYMQYTIICKFNPVNTEVTIYTTCLNIHKICTFRPHCIHVFFTIHTINSDHFSKQH
jgi:hypothetical protein